MNLSDYRVFKEFVVLVILYLQSSRILQNIACYNMNEPSTKHDFDARAKLS